jgi:prepilin-type N-terminal cleavage/methylation domain-containing protein
MARRQQGHTLVELLVVVTIAGLLINVAMLAWRPLSASTLALRDRAQHTSELHLVVESLLQDLGGAATALPTLDGELLITREQAVAELAGAWDGADEGILYALVDGDLLRRDEALGLELVLASSVSSFEISRVSGTETHIALSAGSGSGQRSVELIWPQ